MGVIINRLGYIVSFFVDKAIFAIHLNADTTFAEFLNTVKLRLGNYIAVNVNKAKFIIVANYFYCIIHNTTNTGTWEFGFDYIVAIAVDKTISAVFEDLEYSILTVNSVYSADKIVLVKLGFYNIGACFVNDTVLVVNFDDGQSVTE